MSDESAQQPDSTRPERVAMRHKLSGRFMRATRTAFDERYSLEGWVLVSTGPPDTAAVAEGQPAGEATGGDEPPVDLPADKPRKRSASGGRSG